MLQNHSSHLPRGHHRRQQSVPTALDNLKITYPARHATHHQGLSFDQTTQLHGFPELRPQETKTITNQAQPQQIIPETQLRPMARPGPQRHNSDDSTLRPQHLQTSTDKSTGCFKTDLSEQEIRDMTIDQIYDLLASRSGRQDQEHSFRASAPTEDFDGTLLEREKFPTALQGDKSPRDIEIPDGQEASKRNLIQSPKVKPQRPCTPPTQINRSFFPMTPDPTPYKSVQAQLTFQSASTNSSPIKRDANVTLKAPQPMHRGMSCHDLFTDQTSYVGASNIPSPPGSAPLLPPASFSLPEIPLSTLVDVPTMGVDFSADSFENQSSHCSPMSGALSPTISSLQSSPELTMLQHPGLRNQRPADFALFPEPPSSATESMADFGGCLSPGKKPSHSRSESTAGLDTGLTTVETGISSEEVNAFISGPQEDQKWVCMYPECGKRFGRKENIKSHVQTHLGDRQFLCIHCNKRFVRQHDLKRHEKIHTGIKPYPCECGHSFARMDALTRHKQRNTCIGGIGGPEGYEKKSPKRGRPRKHRPDTEERLEKASRTRQRVLEKQTASSISGSSVCSFPSPPPLPDCYDTDASAAFPSPPQIFEHYDTDASIAMSRQTSSSRYGTPPELDPSSSSPITSRFFDFDGGSGTIAGSITTENDDSSRGLPEGLAVTQDASDIDRMILEFSTNGSSLSSGEGHVHENKQQPLSTNFDFTFVDENPFGLDGEFLPAREDLSWALEGL